MKFTKSGWSCAIWHVCIPKKKTCIRENLFFIILTLDLWYTYSLSLCSFPTLSVLSVTSSSALLSRGETSSSSRMWWADRRNNTRKHALSTYPHLSIICLNLSTEGTFSLASPAIKTHLKTQSLPLHLTNTHTQHSPQKGGEEEVRRKSFCSVGTGDTVIPLFSDKPENTHTHTRAPGVNVEMIKAAKRCRVMKADLLHECSQMTHLQVTLRLYREQNKLSVLILSHYFHCIFLVSVSFICDYKRYSENSDILCWFSAAVSHSLLYILFGSLTCNNSSSFIRWSCDLFVSPPVN